MARCPCCKIQLERINYERVPIYNCGQCGGHWLDQMRLDVILERREVDMPEAVREKMLKLAADSNTKKRLWCIPCGTEMRKAHFKYWSDIEIDRCPKCNGLWFDRGELEKCQIYWEYLQDNPDTLRDVDVMGKKAMIEAELAARRAINRSVRNHEAGLPAHGRLSYGGGAAGLGAAESVTPASASWKEGAPEKPASPLLGILSRLLGR